MYSIKGESKTHFVLFLKKIQANFKVKTTCRLNK